LQSRLCCHPNTLRTQTNGFSGGTPPLFHRFQDFGDTNPIPLILVPEHIIQNGLSPRIVILCVNDIEHVIDQSLSSLLTGFVVEVAGDGIQDSLYPDLTDWSHAFRADFILDVCFVTLKAHFLGVHLYLELVSS
jgi:hypothetical protein